MNPESSLPQIRKAIEGDAQKLASMENLKAPEERHYKEVIKRFKEIRSTNPNMLKSMIEVSAKTKELNDELGMELSNVLKAAFNNAEEKNFDKIINTLFEVQKIKGEGSKVDIHALKCYNELIDLINYEIKSNEKVIAAFRENTMLLEKALSYTSNALYILIQNLIETKV